MCGSIYNVVGPLIRDIIRQLKSAAGLVNLGGGLFYGGLVFIYCFVEPWERWMVRALRWLISLGGLVYHRLIEGREGARLLEFPELDEPKHCLLLILSLGLYFLLCLRLVAVAGAAI